MFTFNGIGTKLYGNRDVDSTNGSYITTKWFTIFYLPIFPLGSFRVVENPAKFLSLSSVDYQMTPVKLNWNQIRNVYAAIWGVGFLLIGIFILIGKYLN
jgi:hypothetical protein